MKYLIQTTEVFRVDTEEEAQELIEAAKANNMYALKKYNCEYKEKKSKGDVIDDWYKVTLTKSFNDEKEPIIVASVEYQLGE
jgi:hypothetical protein